MLTADYDIIQVQDSNDHGTRNYILSLINNPDPFQGGIGAPNLNLLLVVNLGQIVAKKHLGPTALQVY